MLGVGWTEMLIIGVVALIVIGPKDLPVVMGRIGKFAGQIRRMGAEFQREINRTSGLDEVRNLRTAITEPLKKTADEIRRDFNVMTPTGVKPSGAIKPADPKTESVAEEIRAAAGIPTQTTPTLAAAAPTPEVSGHAVVTTSEITTTAPAQQLQPAKSLVKAKRPAKLPAVIDSEVKSTALVPLDQPPADAAVTKTRTARRSPKPATAGEPSAAPPEASPDVANAVASDKPVRRRTTRVVTAKTSDPTATPDQTEST